MLHFEVDDANFLLENDFVIKGSSYFKRNPTFNIILHTFLRFNSKSL